MSKGHIEHYRKGFLFFDLACFFVSFYVYDCSLPHQNILFISYFVVIWECLIRLRLLTTISPVALVGRIQWTPKFVVISSGTRVMLYSSVGERNAAAFTFRCFVITFDLRDQQIRKKNKDHKTGLRKELLTYLFLIRVTLFICFQS